MLAAVELGREANRLGSVVSSLRDADHVVRWRAQNAARAGSATAWRVTEDAITQELLPAILGGEWIRTKTWLPAVINPAWKRVAVGYGGDLLRDLFDHDAVFRRKGRRGPTTMEFAALIGQPYNALDEGGVPIAAAVKEASVFAKRTKMSVWASKALSPWYPGWTSLVIAARGLPARVSDGFVELAR